MRHPMRILHVNLSSGGLGRYGALFAQALAARDDVKTLSVMNDELLGNAPIQRILRDAEVLECSTRTLVHKEKTLSRLREVIRSWGPDIIHDTAGSGYALGVIFLWLVKGGVPWLVTEHDPEPHLGMGTSLHSRLARQLIRRYADHIFVHGPRGKQTLIRQGVEPSRVTIIRHGRLDPLFDCRGAEEIQREPYTILFFGGLRPNKGVQLLVSIADKLHAKYPHLIVIVAGSPEVARELKRTGWSEELKRILAEMRKRPYFEVHDRFIPDDEVALFFRRASITLLPYLDATQSGVAMVAMPFGSVVVATRVGDLPYTIEDGVTGLLADSDVDDIIEKLDWALSNQERLERIGNEAKNWTEEHCKWEILAKEAVVRYRQMLGGEE